MCVAVRLCNFVYVAVCVWRCNCVRMDVCVCVSPCICGCVCAWLCVCVCMAVHGCVCVTACALCAHVSAGEGQAPLPGRRKEQHTRGEGGERTVHALGASISLTIHNFDYFDKEK